MNYQTLANLESWLAQQIVGQHDLIHKLMLALLADGHLLVEGAPGLAKTRAIKEMAAGIEGSFHRIQFTPDLLPGDITGTDIFRPQTGAFEFQQGPIFNNLVLADEINRAPAKVQSALLEAMAERQVSIGSQTYTLPDLFLVMATQNPIEQEGTYPLPEAQMDRFLMHVNITYPPVEDEVEVIRLVRAEEAAAQAGAGAHATEAPAPIPQDAVFAARREIAALKVAPEMERYIADLVNATRVPAAFGDDLKRWIEVGASPRASLALDKCGRTHAWLAGRDYVDPEDIRAVVADVLRHRLGLSYEAQGEGISPDAVVAEIVRQVALP